MRSETTKPTRHVARTVEGWTVRVDDRLLAPPHEETGRRALRFLEARLFDIRAVVPAGPLERLQRVVLVLDLSHDELTAMQYGLTDPKEFFGPPNIPSIVQAALYDVGGGGVASLLASGRVSG